MFDEKFGAFGLVMISACNGSEATFKSGKNTPSQTSKVNEKSQVPPLEPSQQDQVKVVITPPAEEARPIPPPPKCSEAGQVKFSSPDADATIPSDECLSALTKSIEQCEAAGCFVTSTIYRSNLPGISANFQPSTVFSSVPALACGHLSSFSLDRGLVSWSCTRNGDIFSGPEFVRLKRP